MSNQENGHIKHLKLRIPMEMYQQLIKDAEYHKEPPATRARHILRDALKDIELTPEDIAKVKAMVDANWTKIRKDH